MNKNILILLILIFNFGCVSNNHNNYFEFDDIEYYRLDPKYVKLSENIKIIEDKDSSKIENFEFNIIHGYKPDGTSDKNFPKKLLDVGYVKKSIEPKFYNEISSIFSEKRAIDSYSMGCIPWFRDILIFKNKGNISGIAKICFKCRQSIIRGTIKNVENFGQDGDFEKLNKILNEENK